MPGNNGRNEWSKHVLAELERLNSFCEKLDEKLDHHMLKSISDISSLKTKAGLWGAIAGLIPVFLGLGYLLIKHFMNHPVP